MAGALLGNDGLDRKRVLPIGARHGRNRPVEVDANLGENAVRNRSAELDGALGVNVVRNCIAELAVEVLSELVLLMMFLASLSLGTVIVLFWNLQSGVRI